MPEVGSEVHVEVNLKENVVTQLVKQQFQNTQTRINKDASALLTEYMKMIVGEAISRTASEAVRDGQVIVTIQHFEKVLPEFLLDL
eukprot:Clim_evm43s218 gene=Clim_evmTU43s218